MSHNQYSLANHTILPLIYRILNPQLQRITYLLKDPKTSSLIMLGCEPQIVQNVLNEKKSSIQEIQHQSQCKLQYIFFNTPISKKIHTTQRNQKLITAQQQGDLRPLIIGDHSVCFIDAKGYKNPFSLIAATHLTQQSTKIPVLFPGTLIGPCSIDFMNKQVKAKDYIASLQKIKFFPNEAYIFPSMTVSQEDILFAKALIQSPFIDQKIKLFEKSKKFGDALIPTTVLQQKMLNPYLISNTFKDILGTTDKEKSFMLLRKMRQQFRKS